MATMDMRCKRCGEDSWAGGTLQSMPGITFQPDDVKFLSMETGSVKIRARMCTVCGAVELIGDVGKLERILAQAAPEP
jgi:ribosomal protein S27AE